MDVISLLEEVLYLNMLIFKSLNILWKVFVKCMSKKQNSVLQKCSESSILFIQQKVCKIEW